MFIVKIFRDCFDMRNTIQQKPKEERSIQTVSEGLLDTPKSEPLLKMQDSDSYYFPLLKTDNSEPLPPTTASLPIKIPSPKKTIQSNNFYSSAYNEIKPSKQKTKNKTKIEFNDSPIKAASNEGGITRVRTETPSQMFENDADGVFVMDVSF